MKGTAMRMRESWIETEKMKYYKVWIDGPKGKTECSILAKDAEHAEAEIWFIFGNVPIISCEPYGG